MADRSVSVILRAVTTPFVAGMAKAQAATTGFARTTQAQVAGTQAKMTQLGNATGALPGRFAALTTAGGFGLAAVGLAAVAAVKKFADFDVAMDAVGASTGATGAELEQLGQAALEAAADTKFGATEAAYGIEALGKAGIETADIVGGGLKGALDLAAAGGIEVAEAAELAASAMTQFNLKGSDVPHIADLMAAAAGKAQGDVADMGMAFKQSGLVASQMGLSIEETTGTLAAFASAGLTGSDAGTSFRTMLLRLANPTDESAARMKALGLSAYDAQGNFVGMEALAGQLQKRLGGLTQEQRNASLAIIFGQDAIRGANVLFDEGARGIDQWGEEVNDAGYAAEQAALRTDNLRGDVEKLGGAFEAFAIGQGGPANDVLRQLVQTATGLIEIIGELDEASRDFFDTWNAQGTESGEPTAIGKQIIATLDVFTVGLFSEALALDKHTSAAEANAVATERVGEIHAEHAENLSGYANAERGVAVATDAATESAGMQTQILEEQVAAWSTAAGSFVSFTGAYETALSEKEEAERETAEATAAATETGKDSWRDFATDVTLSIDEYLAELEAQVVAQQEWETNLLGIAADIPPKMLAELVEMGPAGAQAVALMNQMTLEQLDVAIAAWEAKSGEGAAGIADRLAEAAPVLAEIAAGLGQEVADNIAQGMADNGTSVYQEAQAQGVLIDNGVGIRRPRVVPISPRVAERDVAAANKKIATMLNTRYIDIHFRYREPTGGVGGLQSAYGVPSGNRIFPLPGGPGAYRVTQGPHPVNAIDYGASTGTPVMASFTGQATMGDLGNRSYGKNVFMIGAGQRWLRVAHMSRFARGSGPVTKGQLLGWTGNTGNSTGPHAHIENFHTGGWTKGGLINTLPGEYIVNPSAAARNAGGLEAMNSGRGGGVTLEFRSGGSHTDDLLLQLFRKVIRVNGGNVQTVLGG